MNPIIKKSSCTDFPCPGVSSNCLSSSPECTPFLNWKEEEPLSQSEKAVVFQSLVATMKLRPAFDDFLIAKAVKFLEYVQPKPPSSTEALLHEFGQTGDNSLTDFIQSIVVLISSPNRVMTTAAMEILRHLVIHCFPKSRFSLVKADLIPQLILTLNPLSLSFAEAVEIHTGLVQIISYSLFPSTPVGLRILGIEDDNEQQAVHETILKQVVVPSEKYICDLCMHRFSIVDGDQSRRFMTLLARLFEITPYFQQMMQIVLKMPVFLTIPSCLTFFDDDYLIFSFLACMNEYQQEWNKIRGSQRHIWQTVQRLLRLEGIEDVIETKLQNNENEFLGQWIVGYSIEWNDLQGMNIPEHE
ncbi:hypothetical protein BLNAU_4034 [Blattamonas nauphoetae]|uniref:Uncharacterized protein n=1 Tax=Blattamonas nauphoetae TaxID=2049346 RepID=A0ABQ9YAZ6_9EUKA|nr:hypothetical protein BLNAU_4034 [Blattamonas nauphoetae]